MEQRRLGPVVGLGTWNTFGRSADHVLENAGAGDLPWFDAEQRSLVERLAA